MSTNYEITISTVTPVYLGADYLKQLVEQLDQVRKRWIKQDAPMRLIESIFVDDGSIDNSHEVLEQLKEKYSWINVLTLSRNYGQHSATVTGICHTSSDWVVTLDEDLQHHPRMIENLLKTVLNEGSDVVYAKPYSFSHGNTWRDKTSRIIKILTSKMSGIQQIRMFNSFRLIRGPIARAAASSSSSQTYLDIALSWYTQSASMIELDMKDERFIKGQKSNYSFNRLLSHAKRLIISSETNITTIGIWLGTISVILSGTIGGYVVIQKFISPDDIGGDGWASLVAIICAFSGIIIGLVCVVMEYINVILLNQLGKPTFFTIDRSSDKLLKKWFSK